MLNRLGRCRQCGEALCLRPDRVACTMCGLPVPDHDLAPPPEPKPAPEPAAPVAAPVPAKAKKKG